MRTMLEYLLIAVLILLAGASTIAEEVVCDLFAGQTGPWSPAFSHPV